MLFPSQFSCGPSSEARQHLDKRVRQPAFPSYDRRPAMTSSYSLNRIRPNCRQLFAFALILLTLSPLRAAYAERIAAEAKHGMVASAHGLASEVGVGVLKKGGNAVDAAVATALALAVVYPRAGNLGGGGFALIRFADGHATSIDFRETAPADCRSDLYLDDQGHAVPDRSTVGYRASGVPGTVAGLALAWSKYGSGKLSWSDLIEPARQLASRGFIVTPALEQDLQRSEPLLGRFPESNRIYLRGGRPYRAGELFRQPDLAATLSRLQLRGPKEFYTGKTAQLIVQEMRAHGGLIQAQDLQHYRVAEREPLKGQYRGYEVATMPPPSSGGVALLQMLQMLEPYDVANLGANSAQKIHLFAEVMRRAFRDRAQFVGDPDFVNVPVTALLDQRYIRRRMSDFDPAHESADQGQTLGPPVLPESADTTHLSVVDSAGTAVSMTYTLNGLWGSGVTVRGAGFLLNNEIDDFAIQAGVKNMYGLVQGDANAIAPGKRPLSSMTPTILSKDGEVFLVTGSPGGPTIINTVLLVVTNVIDHGLSVTQAVDAPRFHHQWQPDRLDHEPLFASSETEAILTTEGYTLATRSLYPNAPVTMARTWGDAETILVLPLTHLRMGANDLRSPDSAALGW
jgi:gamma-glutamyltranspeptidase / glutathione hydrolase